VKQLIQTACPLCGEESSHQVLEPRDWMLTRECFPICQCDSCGFWFTNPRPAKSDIGSYYKHEDYISHTSSKKGWFDRVFQLVRRYTLHQKVKLVQRYGPNSLVADYGCGTGHFVAQLKHAGYDAQGYEPDEDARRVTESELGFQTKSIEEFKELPLDSLDVITMWHVLEHVYELREDINCIVEKLRQGGYWIVAVPNRSAADAKQYGEFWAAYDVPRHLYHFVPNDMKRIANEFNLELVEILPMKFDAYYVALLSEKYKGGSVLHAAWNGLTSNRKAKFDDFSSQIYVLRKN
jgi:SAM-dependent methyltransferase